MPRALDRLSPLQRIRRVRRLLREIPGQRALISAAPKGRDGNAARARLIDLTVDLLAELLFLEDAEIMAAVEECLIVIFGGEVPAEFFSEMHR